MTEGTSQQGQGVGRMGIRAASWLAWSVCALSLALLVAGIALLHLQRLPTEGFTPPWLLSSLAVGFAAYPAVGALVASRRPENAVGWLLCGVGLAITTWIFVNQYSTYALFMKSDSLLGAEVAAYLTNMNPGVYLAIFVPLLFPDGRLPSRRWRPVVWLVGVGIAVHVVRGMGYLHPLGIELPRGVLEALTILEVVLLGVGIVGALTSVALRLWRARGEERQQIKWLLYAASVVVVGYLAGVLSPSLIFGGLTFLGFAAMPLGIGIAILKYRLYDIDVVINRTLVYGVLTAVLALIYFGG